MKTYINIWQYMFYLFIRKHEAVIKPNTQHQTFAFNL